MINEYIKKLKHYKTCEEVLEKACLGSQTAMDAIIENATSFQNLKQNGNLSLEEEKLFYKNFVHENYEIYPKFLCPHPYHIFLLAIRTNSKFNNKKLRMDFVLNYILKDPTLMIKNFSYFISVFSDLAETAREKEILSKFLPIFIFNTKFNEDISNNYSFAKELRSYLFGLISGKFYIPNDFDDLWNEDNKIKNSWLTGFNDEYFYFVRPYLNCVYKFFQKIRKCKIPKNPSFTCIDYGDFAQRGEFLAGWFSGDEPHYKNIDDIDIYSFEYPLDEIRTLHQLYMRISILFLIDNYDVYYNGICLKPDERDLTSFGKHFLASSIAITLQLQTFFEKNKITDDWLNEFYDLEGEDVYYKLNNDLSDNFPRLSSLISNFIYRVNAVDYKYLYKEYPDLKEYVEAYNKVCESSVGDEIMLQDIEDIIKKKN